MEAEVEREGEGGSADVSCVANDPLYQAMLWWERIGMWLEPKFADPDLWADYEEERTPAWYLKAKEIYPF